MSEETFRIIVAAAVLIATLCIAVMAVVSVVIFGVVKKLQVKLSGFLELSEPIVNSARGIISDVRPKIDSVTSDAVDIVRIGKEQAGRVGELVKDFSDRAKIQVARIDGKVDETVDQVQTATVAAKEVLMKPVREMDGIFSGIRAALSVYARPRRSSVDHATQDEEMFI